MEISIRGSAAPIIAHCPGMIFTDTYTQVGEENEAASSGTLIHDALAKWMLTGEEPDDGEPWYSGYRAIKDVLMSPDYYPRALRINGHVEEQLLAFHESGIKMTGRPDYFGIIKADKAAELYDYKSGWNIDKEYFEQLVWYAYLILFNYDGIELVVMHIIRRDHTVQSWTLSRKEIEAHVEEILGKILNWDGKFIPGDWCTYCPRKHDCTGLAAKNRSAILAFTGDDAGAIDITNPDTAREYLEKAGVVNKAADAMRTAIKNVVVAAGGSMTLSDGTIMELKDIMTTEIDPANGWDVLLNGVNEVDEKGDVVNQVLAPVLDWGKAIECMEFKTSLVEKAVKATADRGKKEELWQKVKDILFKVGAAKLVPFQTRLMIKSATKKEK